MWWPSLKNLLEAQLTSKPGRGSSRVYFQPGKDYIAAKLCPPPPLPPHTHTTVALLGPSGSHGTGHTRNRTMGKTAEEGFVNSQ